MNLTLAVLAVLACTPAIRARLALGPHATTRDGLGPAAAYLALLIVAGWLGAAVAEAADVSAPTARIAAGLVIAVTSIPDLWRRPVRLDDWPEPRLGGTVPIAFPELFGPPIAAAMATVTIDRGGPEAAVIALVAAVAVVLVVAAPGPRSVGPASRALLALRAAAAVAVGLALTMNGVYDI